MNLEFPLDNEVFLVVVYWLVRQDLLTVTQAALAQLVERILGKDEVSSPNLPSSCHCTQQKERVTRKHVSLAVCALFLLCDSYAHATAKQKLHSSAIRRFLPDGFADAFPGVTGSDGCIQIVCPGWHNVAVKAACRLFATTLPSFRFTYARFCAINILN